MAQAQVQFERIAAGTYECHDIKSTRKALIFDLDGTLVDTVYAHEFAWQRALAEAGLPIDGWRIHRRIATFPP